MQPFGAQNCIGFGAEVNGWTYSYEDCVLSSSYKEGVGGYAESINVYSAAYFMQGMFEATVCCCGRRQ